MSFIHLSVSSEYSVVKGIVRLQPLLDAVADMGMSAVALTDYCNMFAAIKFFNAARARGIKPIFGCELWVDWQDDARPSRVLLLCQNNTGYQNLSVLISQAYLSGADDEGRIKISGDQLTSVQTEGLFACVGGHGCQVRQQAQAETLSKAQLTIERWKQLFPERVVACVSVLGLPGEEVGNAKIAQLATLTQLPVVATNDVCFLIAEDFDAHEARVCIDQGRVLADSSRPKVFTTEQYLKSPEAMQSLFAQWPMVIENTVKLAQRCNVWFEFSGHFLPNFPIPSGASLSTYFLQVAQSGLETRFQSVSKNCSLEQRDQYQLRLEMECKMITKMGFGGYFLIVADFINWAKSQGIPVGPGRGSGAGSLVAYALEITDIDPLQYDLLFERFLNPERVSMPDFDIDFCMEGRDRVIDYVAKQYGRDNVSQIITFGTMAARAVVRDVGRVLSQPYGFVDQLAKLVPMDLGMTLSRAMQQEPLLLKRYEESPEVSELIDLALKLEGIIRGVGKHAGGVVIAPRPLQEFTPLYCETPDSSVLSQFDKDDIESIGLVKFDFLGLKTLTIIDWTVRMIQARHLDQADFKISEISLEDMIAFKLLQSCQTTAVFQLESRGMKDLIQRLKPDTFEEIVALVALFRPGPLQAGMVDDYIDRKHGRAPVSYLHPSLESVLKPTYGVILYQEQVMQIAQVLSGYTLGGADVLRRAMGKKKIEEMAKQRAIFVNGAVQRGHEAVLASRIFDLIEKFAGYGFNKSHSVAYALLAYQTLWLKSHYPAEFMACALSADMDHTDKVLRLLQAVQSLKLKVLPPDVNTSEYRFTVPDSGVLCYGLGAIKGLGQVFSEALVQNRQSQGPYTDLCDMVQRLSAEKINRKTLECLVRSGALDAIIPHRAAGLRSINTALAKAEQYRRDEQQGQMSLFSTLDAVSSEGSGSVFEYVSTQPWSEWHQLKEEKVALGLYLSGHPLNSLRPSLNTARVMTIAQVVVKPHQQFVSGLVAGMRIMQGRRGQPMAFVTIEDETGRLDVALFGDAFSDFRQYMVTDQCVLVRGTVSADQFSQGVRMQAEWVLPWGLYLKEKSQALRVTLVKDKMNSETLDQLKHQLKSAHTGHARVEFLYHQVQASAQVKAGEDWSVEVTEALIEGLNQVEGVLDVSVVLGRTVSSIENAG